MQHPDFKNNFVYLIYNKINRRMYIGVKSSDQDPYSVIGVTYFSSSVDKDFLQDQKCNPDHYRYKVLANFSNRKDAVNLEVALHERYDVAKNPRFYNLAKQTTTRFDAPRTEENNRKVSESLKRHYATHPETRAKISEASKRMWQKPERMAFHLAQVTGRKHTEESRKKMSAALKGKYTGEKSSFWGKKHTEEYKEKMSQLLKGRKVSDETKAKISKANRGRSLTPEHRLAVSLAHKGRKHSKESVERMRAKLTGRKMPKEAKELLHHIALNRPRDHVCSFCGGSFTAQVFGQWHGDKCKNKPAEFNDEIISIEPAGETEMIDIEVGGDHLMYVNDVLVHNCAINKTDDVDNSAIADSISLASTADMILMCLQSEEMKEKCEMVIKITKNRYTGRTDTFMMGVDYDHMRFTDLVQPFKTASDYNKADSFAKSVVKEHEAQVARAAGAGDMESFLKDLGI